MLGIVGAGPAGLAAALCLARLGLRSGTDRPAAVPHATTARPPCSQARCNSCATSALGRTAARAAEALSAIRIVDDMGALAARARGAVHRRRGRPRRLRLQRAERGACRGSAPAGSTPQTDHTDRDTGVTGLVIRADHVDAAPRGRTAALSAASSSAPMAATRCAAAQQESRRARWSYEQSALTCTFSHQRAARRRLDRVPPPCRAADRRPLARPPLEPRLGRAARRGPATRRTWTRRRSAGALEARLQGLLGPIGEIGPRGRLSPFRPHGGRAGAQPRGARGRGRARHSAHRRARPQLGLSRRGDPCRLRGRRAASRAATSARQRRSPPMRARAAPTSHRAPGRSICSIAA